MKVHHIGYYVTDIEEAQQEFISLGYTMEGLCTYDEERRIYVQFLRNGSVLVELVAPAEGCSLFPKSRRKIGASPYHICYECENIEKAAKKLQEQSFLLMRPPSPAPAIANHRVAFLYSTSVGMVELVET